MSENTIHENGLYNADKIQCLEFPECVQRRPGMYIGDTHERGYHHCVFEIVDNAIDEAVAGFCTVVDVVLHADGRCTVTDNGRGIPVDLHPGLGKSALEVVFSVLHAGGKFGGEGYRTSTTGLHGVGASVVNALSDRLEVTVRRGGQLHHLGFEHGHVAQPISVIGTCPVHETGTSVTFHLDEAIFFDDLGQGYVLQWDILAKRFNELSFLNPGVEIRLTEEASGRTTTFLHKEGIAGYIRSLTAGATSIEPINAAKSAYKPCEQAEVVQVKGDENEVSVEVVFQFVRGKDHETVFSFANNVHTVEGGTHLTGFCTALTSVINDYARRNNLFKRGEETFTGSDVREGIVAVISVKVPEPQFEGQTKTKLGNSEVAGIVQRLVGAGLKDCLNENKALALAIVEQARLARTARQKAHEASAGVREGSHKGFGRFLGKLRDCSSRNPEECELFIVEGDSAGGSATQGRDRRFQAILPLRGKVLNTQKSTAGRMAANNEIRSLISAIGAGVGVGSDEDSATGKQKPFDVTKIRYNKIIIMTDADVDGAHIRTLLLTFFYNQMRPLMEHGHIYLAQPPLYMIKRGRTVDYVGSDAQLTAHLISSGASEVSFRSAGGSVSIPSDEMPELLHTIAAAEDICKRLIDQKVNILRYFAARNAKGEFPRYRVQIDVDGTPVDHYLFTSAEAQALKEKVAFELGFHIAELDHPENSNYICTEILQADLLRRHIDTLTSRTHFGYKAFWGTGSVLGSLVDAKGDTTPITSLIQLLEVVRARGRKGVTIQRYKGLGEMNQDQLFDTTMDPKKRKLRRVVLDSTAHADRVFQKLMGDEVAPRRQWIEENALNARIDA